MEPNHSESFEREIKAKMSAREIQPNPHAWDRLDAMLNRAEEEKKPRANRLGWLYMAAAILTMALIASIYFTQITEVTPQINNVVSAPEAVEKTTSPSVDKLAAPVYKAPSQIVDEQRPQSQFANVSQPESAVETPSGPIAERLSSVSSETPYNVKNPGKTLHVNVDELLASVDKKETTTQGIVKIEPGSLLSQVDGELELSFRERVIKSVEKNYKNVKVALSNRNQE
jgi:hypothetical protein